ncbi:MAG: iron-sulfur cluster assembly scaffold protein [Desulfobacteraceae bacterium]|nr:MAG: iron-sulfur cluster assembly scaffold protein [Desulfobacteraceae bacterium]
MDRLDDFLDKLQEEIFDDARQALGEKGFERWRNPRFAGRIKNPDAHGRINGVCGDTMEMYFMIESNRVKKGSYITSGCASSSISGSFAVELALGKTLEELLDISGEDILSIIGGLPEDDRHCAFLAAQTIHDAVRDYMNHSKSAG